MLLQILCCAVTVKQKLFNYWNKKFKLQVIIFTKHNMTSYVSSSEILNYIKAVLLKENNKSKHSY